MATSTAAFDLQASTSALTANPATISGLLSSLGLTPEDLQHHADQMREFLQTRNAPTTSSPASESSRNANQQNSETPLTTPVAARPPSALKRPMMPLPPRRSHVRSSPPPSEPSLTRRSRSSASTSFSKYQEDAGGPVELPSARKSYSRHSTRSHVASSPARPKISLDEVMKIRSQKSRRVSDSEESEESAEESLHDMFKKAPESSSARRYRYPHPGGVPSSVYENPDRHYRDATPATTRRGNYYRDLDGSVSSSPFTPGTLRRTQSAQSSNQPNGKMNALSGFQTPSRTYYRKHGIPAHLQESSPTRGSSPFSSPARIYNVVSSPGPMSDPPDEHDADLPYSLPPGPYSTEKPDFSYAALIGQAILASPDHALRLKDIYDYISIVYPFFKRDGHSHGQKWMNAIRQNLTNTPQFFKRENPNSKPSKGALWCIAEENLPCFANGGYNRHALNPDSIQNVKAEKRKRKKEERVREEKAKRIRMETDAVNGSQAAHPHGNTQFNFPHYTINEGSRVASDLIFPPLPADHPYAHLISTGLPAPEPVDEGVIFPPLPAYSSTRIAQEQRAQELSSKSSSPSLYVSTSRSSSLRNADSDDECSSPVFAPPPSSEASSSSIPDLTPNNSSSSPTNEEKVEEETDDFDYFSEYIDSESQSLHEGSATDGDEDFTTADKGKGKDNTEQFFALPDFMRMPQSPTATRRTRSANSPGTTSLFTNTLLALANTRPSTPPPKELSPSSSKTPKRRTPETPTRKRKVSREGVSASTDENNSFLNSILQTPYRRSTTRDAGPSFDPVTPRKTSSSSPFGSIFTPFRTPGRRNHGVFDPIDPSSMLNEELDALATAKHRDAYGSPGAGIFPRGKGILYESPNLPSPDKWRPW